MLAFLSIRSAIVRGLKAYTGLPVIEYNGGGDIPEGSFFTYDFADGFGKPAGFPILLQEDGKQIHRETVTFTVSFLSYADDIGESIQNAILAQSWFKLAGREKLKESVNVVVVNIGDIQNRDVNIGEEWERRQGFDVDFRTIFEVKIEDENGFIEKGRVSYGGD